MPGLRWAALRMTILITLGENDAHEKSSHEEISCAAGNADDLSDHATLPGTKVESAGPRPR